MPSTKQASPASAGPGAFDPLSGLDDPRLRNALDALTVTARAAAETGTGGLYTPIAATVRAVAGGPGDNFIDRVRNGLQAEALQDQQDAAAHPLSRGLGQAGGTAIGLLAMPEVKGVSLLAKTAPKALSIRAGRIAESELGHLFRTSAALGAGSNVVSQGVSDTINGRFSGLPAYAGAGFTGAVGGVASPFIGASGGAAITGGLTPIVQGGLTGQPASFDDIVSGAGSSAVAGRFAGGRVAKRLDEASTKTKQMWGERLSQGDAFLRGNSAYIDGNRERLFPSTYVPAGGGRPARGYTKPDVITRSLYSPDPPKNYVEAKMGRHAEPSKPQLTAHAEMPDIYRIQHWLPRDVGAAIGAFTGSLDRIFHPDQTRKWR